jgi:Carboxypeptidase regulatory-like domain
MSKPRTVSWALFLLLLSCAFVYSPALKADVTGSMLGTVTDAGGGVLPGVEVVATNLETNQRQSTKTDSLGQYRILAMPVGTYKMEASAPGFQKFLETGIDLTVNQQHRVDIVLQVGNVEQQVEVNAAALQVETTATQLGDVVKEKKMLALPLNGRSYIDLLGLQAGVALVKAAWMSSAPHHGHGRTMKLGKEEAIGILAAVEMWAGRPSLVRMWPLTLRSSCRGKGTSAQPLGLTLTGGR